MYCDYNSSKGELVLNTSMSYDAATAEDSAMYFWKPFIENTKYIPEDVVIMDSMIARHKGFLLFVGLVERSVLKENKVVGHCKNNKISSRF